MDVFGVIAVDQERAASNVTTQKIVLVGFFMSVSHATFEREKEPLAMMALRSGSIVIIIIILEGQKVISLITDNNLEDPITTSHSVWKIGNGLKYGW